MYCRWMMMKRSKTSLAWFILSCVVYAKWSHNSPSLINAMENVICVPLQIKCRGGFSLSEEGHSGSVVKSLARRELRGDERRRNRDRGKEQSIHNK